MRRLLSKVKAGTTAKLSTGLVHYPMLAGCLSSEIHPPFAHLPAEPRAETAVPAIYRGRAQIESSCLNAAAAQSC